MKRFLVILWMSFLLSGVIALFWYNDWVYQLPTPVPQGYAPVPVGRVIQLTEHFESGEKPVFLHFFNPDCPCSRFNVKQFQALVRQYREKVDFMVVVMSKKTYTAEAIQAKLDLNIPVSFDSTLANVCGVYSTPQAVLLSRSHKLYYKGNYNRTRYCTDEKTSYAKIALAGLLGNNTTMSFDPLAIKAYGCSLPYCKN